MRLLLALLVFIATPALAADWGHYENARHGYPIHTPPAFGGQGESDNGDGQVFSTSTALLRVYGSNLLDGDFEASVKQNQKQAEAEGWALTYQVSTPTAASYSGKKGGHILYVRMIALCHGTQAATFDF